MFKKIISAITGSAKEQDQSNKGQGGKSQANKKQDSSQQKNTAQDSKSKPHDRSKHEKKPHKAAQKSDFKQSAKGNQKHQAQAKPPAKPWKLEEFVVEPKEGETRFHDMQLPDTLMRGIQESGFKYCTPIQAQSLPAALKGSDILGQAQTGTGKSAAFLTAVINRLLTQPLDERFASEPRALIVAPTRELVMQIGKDARGLAEHTGLKVVTIVGGMDYEEQAAKIKDICERYNVEHIGIDVTGLGAAVAQLVRKFYPAVREYRYTPEVKVSLVTKTHQIISKGRLEFDAGWSDMASAFMAIRKSTTTSGTKMTYMAGRNGKTGHADLAWAAMHALDKDPLDGDIEATESIMEIY